MIRLCPAETDDWERDSLKQATIAWAAENGIGELYTWPQRGNENMQRVNERLGYVVRSSCISVRGPVPLT